MLETITIPDSGHMLTLGAFFCVAFALDRSFRS